MIRSKLVDYSGKSYGAAVTKYGQLVTSTIEYSKSSSKLLDTANTVYNLIYPRTNNLIVITDIMLYANKNVSTTVEAAVDIYESNVGPLEILVDSYIITTPMARQSSRDLIGLNIVTSEGSWVNIKTSDDDIYCTIMYYYLPLNKGVINEALG